MKRRQSGIKTRLLSSGEAWRTGEVLRALDGMLTQVHNPIRGVKAVPYSPGGA